MAITRGVSLLQKSNYVSGLIKDMEERKSVLLTFGEPGRTLKKKIALTGFICRSICFIIFNPVFLARAHYFPVAWRRRKTGALKVVRFFFPFTETGGNNAPAEAGKILVINHPTLNDPICAILHALDHYPNSEVIVPINLPWFESICRYRKKLLKIGINIVPILTPETAKRLGSSDNNDISKVQASLIHNYTAEFVKSMSGGGLAVVAQQATRKRHIFKNPGQSETGQEILSTISLILIGLRRGKITDKTYFVPVGVTPNNLSIKPKLNLFHKYNLNLGEPILATDLADIKNAAKYTADLHILLKLAELLPKEYHHENPA